MWDGFEGRKFPRVKADCQIYLEQAGAQPITTKTENIGAGGFSVILPVALPKLSTVKIHLSLADGNQPISCDGRIVWTVTSRTFGSEKLTHDTGVEFLGITDMARERIKRVISSNLPA